MAIKDYLTLETFLIEFPEFTLQQMRWLLLHRESNGLDKAVSKVGRRLYIHIPAFDNWLKNNSIGY